MNHGSLITVVLVASAFLGSLRAAEVERWGRFEATFAGPTDGNPFRDVTLTAEFRNGSRSVIVNGFYDGDGNYRVRFMPETTGTWTYSTTSNRAPLHGKSGRFTAVDPKPGNRGPVRTTRTYHFAYADGTPHYSFGTTCYAWIHQPEPTVEETLKTLRQSPFNKLRLCVFPKWYAYNKSEPIYYPFAGQAPKAWNFDRPNPVFYRRLERRIEQLGELGIEADIILFHPYDEGHWGFDRMTADQDDRYAQYVVARLSAYRHVWWSLANEFDFMKEKTDADWKRLIGVVHTADPYRRLLSIHNGTRIYDHNDPRITHASIQNGSAVADFGRAVLYRDVYQKPVVFDEVKYEGDFDQRWGNLSAEEMTHRFWQGVIAGTYVGHGETIRHSSQQIWWSHGGKLRGASPERIAFLRKIVEQGPAEGIEPIDKWQDERTAGQPGKFYLVYFGKDKPTEWSVDLPIKNAGPVTLSAEVIDTWNMTVTSVPGAYSLKQKDRYRMAADPPAKITLPGKPWMALRLTSVVTTPKSGK